MIFSSSDGLCWASRFSLKTNICRGSAVVRNTKVKNFTAYSKTIGRDTLAFAQSMLTNNMAWIEVDSSYFSIIIDDGSGVKVNEHNMPIQFILNFSLANNERGLRGWMT